MSEIRVSKIRVSKIRVSEIRGSEIRGSKIRVSEIRGSKIRGSEIRVSKIRISSNHRELHGAIFFKRLVRQVYFFRDSCLQNLASGPRREAKNKRVS